MKNVNYYMDHIKYQEFLRIFRKLQKKDTHTQNEVKCAKIRNCCRFLLQFNLVNSCNKFDLANNLYIFEINSLSYLK